MDMHCISTGSKRSGHQSCWKESSNDKHKQVSSAKSDKKNIRKVKEIRISHEIVLFLVMNTGTHIFLMSLALASFYQFSTFSLDSCYLTSLVHLLRLSVPHHGNWEITVHRYKCIYCLCWVLLGVGMRVVLHHGTSNVCCQLISIILHHHLEQHFCPFLHSTTLAVSFNISKRHQPKPEGTIFFQLLAWFAGRLKKLKSRPPWFWSI